MTPASLGPVQGTLELVVLKALAAGGAMHGFAILDWVLRRTDDELVIEDGALYHALYRMQDRGWLESGWGTSEKGRRAKYYALTRAGRAALADEAERWERYVEAVAKLAPDEAGG